MSQVNFILSITLPILLLLSFGIIMIIFISFFGYSEVSTKGLTVFRLDWYARKILPIDSGKRQKFIISGISKKTWSPLKMMTKGFVDSEKVSKQFRDALNYIGSNNKEYIFDFTSKVQGISKRYNYKFNIVLSPKEDDSNFIMTITWNIIRKENNNRKSVIKFIDKEHVVENTSIIKGFVAFNLNNEIKDASSKLINTFKQFAKKDLIYFINNDLLIVSFFGNTIKKVNSQIQYFISKMKNKGFKKGAKTFFDGSGYTVLKSIDTNKSLVQTMKALDFFINLSINLNKNFVSNHSKSFNLDDYKNYSNNSKIFRASLRSGDIKTELIPVKNRKTKKGIISYASPKIDGIDDNMLKRLLTNRNYKIDYTNAHAQNIGIKSTINKPTLIDVDSSWLIGNYKKLEFKKAVYVIDVKHGIKYEDLKDVVIWMSENKFYFAIRIINFNEMISTLVKQTSPQFIIIDKSAWRNRRIANAQTYISLLTIKEMAEFNNIKVIYENPSSFIDKNTIKKINMNFYYNL